MLGGFLTSSLAERAGVSSLSTAEYDAESGAWLINRAPTAPQASATLSKCHLFWFGFGFRLYTSAIILKSCSPYQSL